MQIEYLNIVTTIISAIIGALAGYIIARLQVNSEKRFKKDEIAKSLAELEISRSDKSGIENQYSSISHWIVIRHLLDTYGNNTKEMTLMQLRDSVDIPYRMTCLTSLEANDTYQMYLGEINNSSQDLDNNIELDKHPHKTKNYNAHRIFEREITQPKWRYNTKGIIRQAQRKRLG